MFIEEYKNNQKKFSEYKEEMIFIKDTYKKYKDTHQLLFRVDGKLLNIDKTLEHYEIVLYNLYLELYRIQALEKISKKFQKFSKKNRR